MLSREIDKIKSRTLMTAIVMMFAGLALLILPTSNYETIGFVTGSAFLVFSIYEILCYIARAGTGVGYIHLIVGMIMGIAGLAFLIYPNFLLWSLWALVSLMPLLVGHYGLIHALGYTRRSGRRGWWVLLILSALLLGFVLFVIINPFADTPEAQMRVVGGTLMYSSIIQALALIWLWPARARQEQ